MGFGIDFENLGLGLVLKIWYRDWFLKSGIRIRDSFSQNPGSGTPGSQIADPWTEVGLGRNRVWVHLAANRSIIAFDKLETFCRALQNVRCAENRARDVRK